MNRISVLPVETRSPMSLEEARWAAFFEVGGVPYQHKPLVFTEPDTGATLNQHTPGFLLQYHRSFWLDVLPELNAAVLPAYDEVLHFARTILMIDERERSGYWPVSLDCSFVAFGAPGSKQSAYAGTYGVFVLGSKENPMPTLGGPRYSWAECAFCHRLTLCMDLGDGLGDFSASVAMSCCGEISGADTPSTRPIRNSDRLRRAKAAARRARP
jgi:hypothetical protein